MKFRKIDESIEFTELREGGLSRIWQHTQGANTFAIIGSQDKDTKEDRSKELIQKVSNLSAKNRGKIGYKYLFGRYEYEDGSIGEELSIIIFNIDKEDAVRIGKEVNQESIIWKDDSFFGFLNQQGQEDGSFTSDVRNMNLSDEDIKLFGSRLAKHKNKNQLSWYKFVMEQYIPTGKDVSSIRNMAYNKNRNKEQLFEFDRI